jgi:hypothetical protein
MPATGKPMYPLHQLFKTWTRKIWPNHTHSIQPSVTAFAWQLAAGYSDMPKSSSFHHNPIHAQNSSWSLFQPGQAIKAVKKEKAESDNQL